MEPRLAPTAALAIEHVEASSPPSFKLTRLPDGKSLSSVSIQSPYEAPVPGHPKPLMHELRWYLEDFLDYPFPPETTHAEHVLDALKRWGTQAFNTLFDRRDAGAWLSDSAILQIRSDDPNVLSWPWEALFDEQAASFASHQRSFERRLNRLSDPPPLSQLPDDRINILLVVARPYQGDVGYRSLARPLVELIQSRNLPAHATVLRPPTFDNLRDHLRTKPGYYHVLHFDGHGSFGSGAGDYSPHQFRAREGCLLFEDARGDPDAKSAADLSALLHEHTVPAVVLNACRSAALDEEAANPFASVATALLQTGMRSVVAMAYSLYVSGAQVFLPAFYRRLFESGHVAEAVRAGRQQMVSEKTRVSPRGPYPLEDWLLPVLYQQAPIDLTFARESRQEEKASRLPPEAREHRDEYGFIGRDGPILEMERALHRKAPCILIEGLGGIGKTTLARGFLRWLDETDGLDAAVWFDFRDIRASEYVINEIGQRFYGENFGVAKDRLGMLARVFREQRVMVVWDNFESAEQDLSPPDRSELGRFLEAIHGTRGKVIITSRSSQDWLPPSRRFALPLRGLDGEERWEYCDVILRELGLGPKINRKDPELKRLMDQLAGHPLAMRVILPKLERMSAAKISTALRTNLAELDLSEQNEQDRLFATLRFIEQGLPADLQPLLPLVGLHDSYLDAGYMEAMAEQVDPAWTRTQIDRLMAALSSAGLMRDIGNATYEMHPLLTSYLRSQTPTSRESIERAFVHILGTIANMLALRELHEQRIPFLLHGSNFRHALRLARSLSMHMHFGAITQALAFYAQNIRNFTEASRLFEELAEHAKALGNSSGETSAYHQLGTIAEEQRDFKTAREWYLKSLAISAERGNLKGIAVTYHQLGSIAQRQRDFEAAREWYLRSLAVEEQQGDLQGAGATYHQLGRIAEEQRDFGTAREWYLKSLAISEKQGVLHFAAGTYHQLGVIAEQQRDFKTAREWYLKSLAIKEKQGNLHGAASTYHQLGIIAQEQEDLETAREWYLKSLAINEKQGNLHGAAGTYHNLGVIAKDEQDFETAREWYLKSLAISEKQGDLHQAASTYSALGILCGKQGDTRSCASWLTRSINSFLEVRDEYAAERAVQDFFGFYRQASDQDKLLMKAVWEEAGFGPFPKDPAL
jgi:tetratricopeptide (TPR) repeat protein